MNFLESSQGRINFPISSPTWIISIHSWISSLLVWTVVMKPEKIQGKIYNNNKSLRCFCRRSDFYQPIRKQNTFFMFKVINSHCHSNLTLSESLEFIYYWSYNTAQMTLQMFDGKINHTLHNWYDLCYDVCVEMFDKW